MYSTNPRTSAVVYSVHSMVMAMVRERLCSVMASLFGLVGSFVAVTLAASLPYFVLGYLAHLDILPAPPICSPKRNCAYAHTRTHTHARGGWGTSHEGGGIFIASHLARISNF
jgi:hypothetical protein